MVELTLYVTGQLGLGRRAIDNLQALARTHPELKIQWTVVDVDQNPGDAERNRIVATPTLVRQGSGVSARLVGDLEDAQAVIQALALVPSKEEP